MSAFEVEYTITSDDAVDVSWAYGRSARRKTTLVGGTAAVVLLAAWWITDFPLALGLAVGAALVVLLTNSRLFLRLQVRFTPATRVGSRYSIAVHPQGIAYDSEGLSGMVEWRAVTRVIEDDKAIVLLQGKAPVGLITKRGLGSPAAVEDFKRLVRTGAPEARWEVS